MNETNLEGIKRISKVLLRMKLRKVDLFPPEIFVNHPYVSSSLFPDMELSALFPDMKISDLFQKTKSLDESGFVDLLEKENFNRFVSYFEKRIDDADLHMLFSLIRLPYKLTLLKLSKDYLSNEDFSKLFGYIWTSSENPNQDANVSIPELKEFFKISNKEILMSESDYSVYQSLPDRFDIYRGVAVGRNPKGLSWTRDLDTAKWFSERFDKEKEKGYILKSTINKKDVFAYFNGRGEEEIVCSPKRKEIHCAK